LRNRLPIERDTSSQERDAKEADFFTRGVWNVLSPSRLGIKHLRTALTKMHNAHITSSIPELIPEIRGRLSSCDHDLAQLGKPRSLKSEQLECMVALASSFSRLSEDALNGYYHSLPDQDSAKLRKIVQDGLEEFRDSMLHYYQNSLPDLDNTILTSVNKRTWCSSILAEENLAYIYRVIQANRGREFPDEVNQNVMGVLRRNQTTNWRTMATALIENLVPKTANTMKVLVKKATTEQELQINTTNWLTSQLPAASEAAADELSRVLSDEARTWTLRPRYSTRAGALYNAYITTMAKSLVQLDDDNGSLEYWDRQIKLWLAGHRNVDTVLNTYVRLKAYHEVAMERFVDNAALQVVERHLLGPSSALRMFTPSYVVKMAEGDAELLKTIAGENEDKAVERANLAREIASLTEALASAVLFGISNN
jgi:hypothetical protein